MDTEFTAGYNKGYNAMHDDDTKYLAGKLEGMLHNSVTPELVEKHFPKGKCQERGKAIVLHAEMLIALKSHLLSDE